MSLPESDPNESVEISGADFAIMCDEIDSLKKQVSRLEIEAEETAYLRIRVDRLKAELAAGQVRELRYREALKEIYNSNYMPSAVAHMAEYVLSLPTNNSELRAVCLKVAKDIIDSCVPLTARSEVVEAIVNEVIGK